MDQQKSFFKRFRWFRNVIVGLFVFFASYAIGRLSHMYFGQFNTPHHWIYGTVALVVGIIFCRKKWGGYVISFGLGFILSDFKDMLDLKFFGADTVMIKKFWGIN